MEEGRISSQQLSGLVISFTIATGLLLPSGREVWQDSWLTLLLGLGGGIIFTLPYTALFYRFAGKSLAEIHELVLGPFLGKLIFAAFLWYVFHLGAGAVSLFRTLLTTTVLTATPQSVLLISWLIVSVYACKKGIEVLARINEVLVLTTVFLIVTTVLLVLNIFKPENLFPILALPASELLLSGYTTTTFPFGQSIVFAVILPFLHRREEGRGVIIKGLIGGCLILLISQMTTVGTVGDFGRLYVFPTYEALRLIQIGQVLTRLELIPVLNFLTMGFICFSLALYVVSLGTAQLFKLRTYRPLVFPLGILMIIAAYQTFPNVTVRLEMIGKVQPVYALPFQFLFPLIILLVAVIRGLPAKGGQT